MKSYAILAVASIIAVGASSVFAQAPKLDGAYKLVSIKSPNGTQTEANVKGMIVVHGKYMAFVRAGVDRKSWSQDDPQEERTKKIVAAFQGLATTCGAFEIKGNTLSLNQHAQAAPSSMGATSKWLFEINANKLTIKPEAAPTVEFIFERMP
jgi:hypothetical protein